MPKRNGDDDMGAVPTDIYECQCDQCDHHWIAKNLVLPQRCPSIKCRSSHWNEGRIDGQLNLRKSDGKPGYIYVIRCGEYYKIGMTLSLERRITELTMQLPHAPEIVCLIPTNHAGMEERRLHKLFSAQRLNGEWFSLTPEDIEKITQGGG